MKEKLLEELKEIDKKLNQLRLDIRIKVLNTVDIRQEIALLEEKERVLLELAEEENKEKVTAHLQRIEDLLRELITVTIQTNPYVTKQVSNGIKDK